MTTEKQLYVPITPGGVVCTWLAAETEEQAWENLRNDDKGKINFKPLIPGDVPSLIERGYRLELKNPKEF